MKSGVFKVFAAIYLLSALFFVCSAFFFYSQIFSFGMLLPGFPANLIRVLFVVISLYLFMGLPRLKRSAFFVAIIFHLFFISNNILMFLEKYTTNIHPAVHIVGLFGSLEYSSRQATIIILNIMLNSVMISYICAKRRLFLIS